MLKFWTFLKSCNVVDRLKHFVGDLVAGLTVGLTVIPQGMAYAQIAELPAQVIAAT